MYEHYLLDAKAITAVLNNTEGHTKTVIDAEVQSYIDDCLADPKYFKPLDKGRGIDWIEQT